MDKRAALDTAMAEAEPSSLGAAQRLRTRFDADTAAWALSQAALRRRARSKFPLADEMLFTADGLEQASREPVAAWRAKRFAAAGVREVWDLGCGIGADAMAFAAAGLHVVAVDSDPATVEVARHNLSLVGGGEVRLGEAQHVDIPPGAAIFLDPARRTARGRTWRLDDVSPPWDFVLAHLAGERFTAVKLGPGVPKEVIPEGVQACWVSDRGAVVEASLWNRLPVGPRAVVLPHEIGPEDRRSLDVAPVGRYVIEPDGAVIRAGLIDALAPSQDLWLLDRHVAYLSSDEEMRSPLATCFEVLEVLDFDVKSLRAWVRDHRIGTLEIKKRAIDVDPAELRAKLKPKGPHAATLILARTVEGTRALVCRRT